MALQESFSIAGMREALYTLGIGDSKHIRRVVIDLNVGNVPIVHVEHYGDARVLEVIRLMAGAQVSIVDAGKVGEDGQGNRARVDDVHGR
jgi:hypothetical protein